MGAMKAIQRGANLVFKSSAGQAAKAAAQKAKPNSAINDAMALDNRNKKLRAITGKI